MCEHIDYDDYFQRCNDCGREAFSLYLEAIIKAPDAEKPGILRAASEEVSIQALELLASAMRLSAAAVKQAMFNSMWLAARGVV